MEKEELIKYLSQSGHNKTNLAAHFNLSMEELNKELEIYYESGLILDTLKGVMLTSVAKVNLGTIVLRKDNFAYIQKIGSYSKNEDIRVSGPSLDGYIVSDKVYFQVDHWNNGTIVGLYKRKSTFSGILRMKYNGEYLLDCKQTEGTKIDIVVNEVPEDVSQGDIVKVKVDSYDVKNIKTTFIEVLTGKDDIGNDISSIIASNDAPLIFPKEVLEQAKNIETELSSKDYENREDYRKETIVTIDGEDALDFDDAISIKRIRNGYEIGVYIADVSYYVTPNTPIDEEALKRGTSIYVADRVVPMLPTELSNGICSLNPHVDRCVMAVIMKVDNYGQVYSSSIHQGVINSKARLTYKQVNDLFAQKETDIPDEIKNSLFILEEATTRIRKRRLRQGALELESTELKFVLDENNFPIDVIKRVQGRGEMLIEDLMIIANVEVAKFLTEKGIPALYRVHDNPPSEKIELFKQYLRNLRLIKTFPAIINSQSLSHWYNTIEDEDLKFAVSGFLLRSLAKAKYSPDNTGHFGLAEDNYLHFTSPIRRYPDLIVHRAIRDYVINNKDFSYNREYNRLVNLGVYTSACERRATNIEREVDDLEACKYMQNHLGEKYDAVVIGISPKGLYCQLVNGIEVTVLIKDIDPSKRWVYSESHFDIQSEFRDENGSYFFFRLGNKLEVYPSKVSLESKTIFAITQETKKYLETTQNFLPLYQEEEDFDPDYSRIKHSRNKSKAVSSSYRPKHNSSFGKGRRSSSYKKKLREEESSYSLKKGRGHKSSHNKGNKSSYNKSRSSSKNSKKNNSRKIHY